MTKFILILAAIAAATAQSVQAHPAQGQGDVQRPREQQQRSAPVERGRVFSAPVERGRVFSAPVERGRVFSAPVERGRAFSAPVERGAQLRVERGNLVLARPELRERFVRNRFVQVVPRTEVIPGITTIVQNVSVVRYYPHQIAYIAPVVSVVPAFIAPQFAPTLVTSAFVMPPFITPTFATPTALLPVDYVYQGYAPVDDDDVAYVTPIATPYVVNPYGNAQIQGVVLAQTGSNLLVMTPSLQTVYVDTGIAQQDGYLQGAVAPGSVVNVLGYYTGSQFIATALV